MYLMHNREPKPLIRTLFKSQRLARNYNGFGTILQLVSLLLGWNSCGGVRQVRTADHERGADIILLRDHVDKLAILFQLKNKF